MGILTFDACASIYNIWISHEIITQGRVLKIKFRKFKFFYSNSTAVLNRLYLKQCCRLTEALLAIDGLSA